MPDLLLLDEPLAGLGWCFYLTRKNISELSLMLQVCCEHNKMMKNQKGKHPKGKHCGSLKEFMITSLVGNFITLRA